MEEKQWMRERIGNIRIRDVDYIAHFNVSRGDFSLTLQPGRATPTNGKDMATPLEIRAIWDLIHSLPCVTMLGEPECKHFVSYAIVSDKPNSTDLWDFDEVGYVVNYTDLPCNEAMSVPELEWWHVEHKTKTIVPRENFSTSVKHLLNEHQIVYINGVEARGGDDFTDKNTGLQRREYLHFENASPAQVRMIKHLIKKSNQS
jgi:hypothetical protein